MASPHSSKFAAFQFYPRDFLASDKVARMSLTEVGIYFTLLCYAWLGNGLPSDVAEIAKLVRIPPARFRRIWAGVLSECFTLKNGKFVNPRQERQRKELQAYVESCARGGERSAKTRKARYGTAQPPKPPRSDNRGEPEVTPNTASASASSTASAIATTERRAPLIARRRLNAAFEGPRVYVPETLHRDFLGLRNGNERELTDWYQAISDEWTDGRWKDAETGADMFKFWRARYDERWPATAPAKKGPWANWKPLNPSGVRP